MIILAVDDEVVALNSMRRLLKRRGIPNVELCNNGKDAIDRIKNKDFDIVLLDLLMPEVDGLQVLVATKPFKPRTEFIFLTAVDDIATAVKAVRLGAYDYLVKPVESERLILSIERAYEHKGLLVGLAGARTGSHAVEIPEAFSKIVTQCPRMAEILSYAAVMARSGNPIMISGESGTGKELMTSAIHRLNSTSDAPFIALNVSSIPETLFESQFFGHIKGAFTGAEKDHAGFFEQANGGTLFLDEIGELSLNLQAKFLRVIEEKSIRRLSDATPIHINVRIISATNQDLDKACQEGRFRLDLLYRLRAAHIHLPPLREREGDIPLLAAYFQKKACMKHDKAVSGFSPEAMDILTRKEYHGNIRELAALVENAVLLAESGLILPQHLGGMAYVSVPSFTRKLCSLKEDATAHFAFVLAHTKGNRKETAQILGISLRQVQRKIALMKNDPRWEPLLGDI
ncbi:MAG: sigma-54 dependent transcriptional regulator [Desulfobacterales bacterium]|nr:sigma-54 dependent transcriptional regulator [Desulfobacterales bacterium]